MTTMVMQVRTRVGLTALAVLATAIALVPLHAGPAGAQGVGISPVRIVFADALRGGTYVQSLNLSNTDPVNEMEFTVASTGDTAAWIRFVDPRTDEPSTSFVVPASGRVQVAVTMQVPDDVANREYQGRIEVLANELDPTGQAKADGADVGIGGFVDVMVRVSGDERRAGRVVDAFVTNAEVGMDQRFEARVQNLGNVTIQARLDVRILRDGEEVTALSTDGQNFPVLPEHDDAVFVSWATAEQLGGDYTAEFTVVDVAGARQVELGTAVVPFRLEPRGTFTRSGSFDGIRLRNRPEPGGIAQIEAVFTNTGEIEVDATFIGELYVGDELVRTIESRARSSRPGETVTLEVPVEVARDGDHRVVGKIDYDGSVTADRELRFEAGIARDSSSRLTTAVVVASLVLASLAALQVLRHVRIRRHAKRAAAARLRAYDREAARRNLRETAGRR